MFINAGAWLSKADSYQKADVLICLGGTEKRVQKSIELYKKGLAPYIVVTESQDKNFFLEQGVPENRVTLLPWPQNTYQEARDVSPLLRRIDCHTVLLVTDPFRIRRARWSFQRASLVQPVKFIFVSSDFPFTPNGWWRDKSSRFYVALELSKNLYYRAFHGFFGLKEDPDWALQWKKRYEQFLMRILL